MFDQAIAENAARSKAKSESSSRRGTRESKVAAVVEATPSKGPPPLSGAARGVYVLRRSHAHHPDEGLIRIHLPDIVVSVLREANSELPVAFKSFINSKSDVTLCIVDTSVPVSSYASFVDALTTRLNQAFPVANYL